MVHRHAPLWPHHEEHQSEHDDADYPYEQRLLLKVLRTLVRLEDQPVDEEVVH